MRSKFSAIHREHSPNPRKFYAFCTSVTDTTTTSGIIASGEEQFPKTSLSNVHGMLTQCLILFSALRVLRDYLTWIGLGAIIVRDMVIRQHLKQSKLL